MNYRKKVLFAALIVMFFLLAGCADSPSGKEPNEMVLRHILHTKIASLDPGSIRDIYSHVVVSQICETLYEYHFLKRPYEVVPLLAEDMPEISEDIDEELPEDNKERKKKDNFADKIKDVLEKVEEKAEDVVEDVKEALHIKKEEESSEEEKKEDSKEEKKEDLKKKEESTE